MRALESLTSKRSRTGLIAAGVIGIILNGLIWLLSGFVGTKVIIITLALILCLAATGILIVIWGSLAKNRWGINMDVVFCPCCGTELPVLRKPRSMRQFLWGGGICPTCGAEVDKWGRQVSPPSGIQSGPN